MVNDQNGGDDVNFDSVAEQNPITGVYPPDQNSVGVYDQGNDNQEDTEEEFYDAEQTAEETNGLRGGIDQQNHESNTIDGEFNGDQTVDSVEIHLVQESF